MIIMFSIFFQNFDNVLSKSCCHKPLYGTFEWLFEEVQLFTVFHLQAQSMGQVEPCKTCDTHKGISSGQMIGGFGV